MNNLYIEQHYALGVSEFEGFWQMTFRDPRNRAEHVTVYLEAPNSHEFNRPNDGIQIAKPGARLEEVLRKLLPSIQAYPYKWPFDGQKIVGYAYDFETDMTGTSLGFVDLTLSLIHI